MRKDGKKLWERLLCFVLLLTICISMSRVTYNARISSASAADTSSTSGTGGSVLNSDKYIYLDADIENTTDAFLCVNGMRIKDGTNSVPIIIEADASVKLTVTFNNEEYEYATVSGIKIDGSDIEAGETYTLDLSNDLAVNPGKSSSTEASSAASSSSTESDSSSSATSASDNMASAVNSNSESQAGGSQAGNGESGSTSSAISSGAASQAGTALSTVDTSASSASSQYDDSTAKVSTDYEVPAEVTIIEDQQVPTSDVAGEASGETESTEGDTDSSGTGEQTSVDSDIQNYDDQPFYVQTRVSLEATIVDTKISDYNLQISRNGQKVDSVLAGFEYQLTVPDVKSGISYTLTTDSKNVKLDNNKLSIDSDCTEGTITVSAEFKYGSNVIDTKTYTVKVEKDQEAPEVTAISFSGTSLNDDVYSSDVVVNVTVDNTGKTSQSDIKEVHLLYSYKGQNDKDYNTFNQTISEVNGTVVYTLQKEGYYKDFSAYAIDEAGNSSEDNAFTQDTSFGLYYGKNTITADWNVSSADTKLQLTDSNIARANKDNDEYIVWYSDEINGKELTFSYDYQWQYIETISIKYPDGTEKSVYKAKNVIEAFFNIFTGVSGSVNFDILENYYGDDSYKVYVNGCETESFRIGLDSAVPKESVTVLFNSSKDISVTDLSTGEAAKNISAINDPDVNVSDTVYTYKINVGDESGSGKVFAKTTVYVHFYLTDLGDIYEDVMQTPSGVATFSCKINDDDTSTPVTCSDGKYFVEIPLTVDGGEEIFAFSDIVLTDDAGNETDAMIDNVQYVVDEKAPIVELTEDAALETDANVVDDVYYINKSVSGTLSVTDLNFYDAGVQLDTLETDFTRSLLTGPVTNTDIENKYDYNYTLDTDGEYQFKAWAIDLCGNETAEEDRVTSKYVIVDKTAPVIEVSYTSGGSTVTPAGADSSFYNASVTVNVSIAEKYLDYDNSLITVTGTLVDGSAYTQDITKNLTQGDGVYALSFEIASEGTFHVEVTAKDLAGNAAENYVGNGFVIDKTAPVITVTFDNNEPLNDKYYNADRTATIKVVDYTFDEAKANLVLTETYGVASVGSWSKTETNTYVLAVTFSQDGIYSFTFDCVDKAGNKSDTVSITEFYIDKTAPEISVVYDNTDVKNEKYYNKVRNASVHVQEMSFDESLVEVNNQKIESLNDTPAIGKFSSSGFTNIAIIPFAKDGSYAYEISCKDLAGNTSTIYTSDLFVIDTTAPIVEFTGVGNYSANNGEVRPVLNYEDKYVDIQSTNVSLIGSNNGSISVKSTVEETTEGYKVTYSDFAYETEMDDLYTLTADVYDLAGNETKEQLIFSVNRFGSVYVISDATKELIDNYYTNKPVDVVITEINVDELTYKDVTVSRDGDVKELSADSDYTVSAQGNEVSWKSFTYTIPADNFALDGVYSVTVYSEDRATNVQDNRSKEAEIDFAVDTTAPGIVVSGLEKDTQYDEGHQITVNATDNMSVTSLEVYADDELINSYDSEKLLADGGTESVVLANGEGMTITIVSTDIAGNESRLEYEGISVGEVMGRIVPIPEPGSGDSIPAGLIVAILAVLIISASAGVSVIIYRKRKKA